MVRARLFEVLVEDELFAERVETVALLAHERRRHYWRRCSCSSRRGKHVGLRHVG